MKFSKMQMSKKILLMYPNESRILEHFGDRAPLNLLYIGGYLRKQGHEVKVWDGNHQSEAELLKICDIFNPDYVGISCYTSPIVKESISLGRLIKSYDPRVQTIAGGYHVNIFPKELLNHFDYVCLGEGENVMTELRDKKERILAPEKVENIDDIPIPARDLVNMEWYNLQQNGKRVATLVSSRGCYFGCVFCGNLNRRVRFHSSERVEEEVKGLIDKYGFKSFYFLDDLFTFNKERVLDITNRLKPLNIKYRIMTRADQLDKDVVKALADSGCEIINLGIESGNDEILRKINKRMTVKQNEDAVKLCKENGIDVKGFFMIGLPGETEETANQTIRFAKKLKKEGVTFADFYLMVPFPGTEIWENPEKHKIEIVDRNFEEYLQVGGIKKAKIRTESLSEERLEYLVEKAREEFENG